MGKFLQFLDKINHSKIAIGSVIIFLILFSIIVIEPDHIFSRYSTRQKANDAKRDFYRNSIQKALDIYFYQHNSFPTNLNQLITDNIGMEFKDPKTGQLYEYTVTNNGLDYKLCFNYETKEKKCYNENLN